MRRGFVVPLNFALACLSCTKPAPPPVTTGRDAGALSSATKAAPVSVPVPAPQPVPAPATAPPEAPAPLSPHFVAALTRAKFTGFIATSKANEHAFASVPGPTFTSASLVPVASFTKFWTAVAVLRFVERNELSLDDTIRTTLPAFASTAWASSTVRELLTHTSRVPEFDEGKGFFTDRTVDFRDPTRALGMGIDAHGTERRGVFKYKNSEYALLGAILEARSRLGAGEVLAREVFGPAHMLHAGIVIGPAGAPRGLDLTSLGRARAQNFFTAGAGYASPDDLLAFFDALAGKTLLSEASKAMLFDGQKSRSFAAMGCWAYALANGDAGALRVVERQGAIGAMKLFSAFYPDSGRAVVAWTRDSVDFGRPYLGPGAGVGFGLELTRLLAE